MKPLALLAALTLAGCGADGAPSKPNAVTPGVSVSGEARIGITNAPKID